eukprot:gene20852-27685_t
MQSFSCSRGIGLCVPGTHINYGVPHGGQVPPRSFTPAARASMLSYTPVLPCAATSARGKNSYSRAATVKVSAVFEQFSNRSIQVAVMSQQLARKHRSLEVNVEHILLSLVTEDSLSRNGYMNSGLSVEKATEILRERSTSARSWSLIPVMRPSSEAHPFSAAVRKTFQMASNECKRMGSKSMFPEHILIATLEQQGSTLRNTLLK